MNEFYFYLQLGLKHILDYSGYDHLLFIVALTAIYLSKDWGKVLILVTAFTVGHSLTLALSTFRVITVNSDLVEFLIPLTIIITAFSNLFKKTSGQKRNVRSNYIFALVFGLIHGLAFSNSLRTLLGPDRSILKPLFAFNLGIEVGQIIVVCLFLFLSFIVVTVLGVRHRDWNLIVSSMVIGVAFGLITNLKFPF